MNSIALLITSLLISSLVHTAPACEWQPVATEKIAVNQDVLALERFHCTIPDWDTSNEADTYRATLLEPNGSKIALEKSNRYEAIQLLEYGDDFPLHALLFSSPGSSNVGNSIRVYTNNWQELERLNHPLNEYQANNREGAERNVIGFFKVNGSYHIENLQSLGGDCMACMDYAVETFKATADGLERVNVRKWDIAGYQPFGSYSSPNDSSW